MERQQNDLETKEKAYGQDMSAVSEPLKGCQVELWFKLESRDYSFI